MPYNRRTPSPPTTAKRVMELHYRFPGHTDVSMESQLQCSLDRASFRGRERDMEACPGFVSSSRPMHAPWKGKALPPSGLGNRQDLFGGHSGLHSELSVRVTEKLLQAPFLSAQPHRTGNRPNPQDVTQTTSGRAPAFPLGRRFRIPLCNPPELLHQGASGLPPIEQAVDWHLHWMGL